jgi:hypothetical protein
MNTSSEAITKLKKALETSHEAKTVIDNLIAVHDYQDVASLVVEAAATLLEAAISLMQSQDEIALDQVEAAEDLLDSAYSIIDGEVDED